MPPKGYRHLSIREEVYREIEKLREELNLTSLNDVLSVLVKTYREHVTIASMLEKIHTDIAAKLSEIHTNIATMPSNTAPAAANMKAFKKKKTSIREIVRERKVQLLSEINPKNPEAFVRSAEKQGVIVIEGTRGDKALVDPEFYDEFTSRLKYFPRNPEEEMDLTEDERKLFRFLKENALIFFDGNEGAWKTVS